MSAGSRSGVHCSRAEVQAERGGQAAGGQRLAQARHVLEQHVPAGEHRGQRGRSASSMPTTTVPTSASTCWPSRATSGTPSGSTGATGGAVRGSVTGWSSRSAARPPRRRGRRSRSGAGPRGRRSARCRRPPPSSARARSASAGSSRSTPRQRRRRVAIARRWARERRSTRDSKPCSPQDSRSTSRRAPASVRSSSCSGQPSSSATAVPRSRNSTRPPARAAGSAPRSSPMTSRPQEDPGRERGRAGDVARAHGVGSTSAAENRDQLRARSPRQRRASTTASGPTPSAENRARW